MTGRAVTWEIRRHARAVCIRWAQKGDREQEATLEQRRSWAMVVRYLGPTQRMTGMDFAVERPGLYAVPLGLLDLKQAAMQLVGFLARGSWHWDLHQP